MEIKMKALTGFVIIKIDTRQKERYRLGGTDIVLDITRGFNWNQREDRPTLATIIDGENLPSGTDVLVNYLALEPVYEILDEDILTKHEKQQGYKILSIPNDMCFAYFHKGEWHPCKEYLITMRVYKPYGGMLLGVEPVLVKNIMYVVKGYSEGTEKDKVDLSGKVAVTLDWADYEIIWTNRDNQEERIIRTRDREVIGIDNSALEKINKGEYLIGLSPKTAKKLKEWQKV